jgi:hypothetical protein
MDEIQPHEFWGILARSANRVLRAAADTNTRFLWVDDIIPPMSMQQSGATMTTAFVTENDGKSFAEYRVKLLLSGDAILAYQRGELSNLLPGLEDSGWLMISRMNKEMEITLTPAHRPRN